MPVPSETVGEEEGDSADSGHGPGLPRPPDSGAHAFARTPCLGVVRRETHGAMTGPPTELPGTAAWGRTASVPTPRPRVGARRTVPSRGQRAPRPPRPAPRPWLSPRCGVKPISAMCSQPGHRRIGGASEHPPQMSLLRWTDGGAALCKA